MDPNLLQATLRSCASSMSYDRHPQHLEREMVAYNRSSREHRSWTVSIRRRSGAALIVFGEHLQGTAPSAHSDQLANPGSLR